jgi:hypothetical protein
LELGEDRHWEVEDSVDVGFGYFGSSETLEFSGAGKKDKERGLDSNDPETIQNWFRDHGSSGDLDECEMQTFTSCLEEKGGRYFLGECLMKVSAVFPILTRLLGSRWAVMAQLFSTFTRGQLRDRN